MDQGPRLKNKGKKRKPAIVGIVLLLCKDTMTKATYKRKPLIRVILITDSEG